MSSLTTGQDTLDRKIGGGIPDSFTFTLLTPWASDAERFIQQLISVNDDKKCIYVSLDQPKELLVDSFQRMEIIEEQPNIIDATDEHDQTDRIRDAIDKAPPESIVVIDSINSLEEELSRRDYTSFINSLKSNAYNQDCTLVFAGTYQDDYSPKQRPVSLQLSDGVFRIQSEYKGEDLNMFISIDKFRGINPPNERLKVNVTESGLRIDTSRDIA